MYLWRVSDEDLESQRILIEELAETIIPQTDTPGAKQAGVADFIINKVKFFLSNQERNVFALGLENIEMLSKRKFDRSFQSCTTQQREAILKTLEDREWRKESLPSWVKRKLFGRSFIDLLKTFTVEGFCTSELGATQCLVYDAVPVHYLPCVNLIQGQRSWATK